MALRVPSLYLHFCPHCYKSMVRYFTPRLLKVRPVSVFAKVPPLYRYQLEDQAEGQERVAESCFFQERAKTLLTALTTPKAACVHAP